MPPACELSAFHNWCDRCCELCPLELACPVSRPIGSFEEVLAKAQSLAEKICEEQGISLDNALSPPPPGIDAVLLCKTATECAVALHELGLTTAGVLLAGKVTRVASYLDDEDGAAAWEADAVPNLLLIEKVMADIDAEITLRRARAPQPLVARIERNGRQLRGLLTPLFATVPELTRRAFAALVTAGCAPSPFVRLRRHGALGARDPAS